MGLEQSAHRKSVGWSAARGEQPMVCRTPRSCSSKGANRGSVFDRPHRMLQLSDKRRHLVAERGIGNQRGLSREA